MAELDLGQLARLTLLDPRAAARRVIALRLGQAERLQAMAAIAILNVLAIMVFVRLAPEAGADPILALLLDYPIRFAALQLGGLFLTSALVLWIGRLFGGKGDFAGAQAMVVLLQVVFLAFQLAQTLAILLVPPLTLLIGLASVAAAIWVAPRLVAELHGFRSVGLTFLGMVASGLVLLLLLTLAISATTSTGV